MFQTVLLQALAAVWLLSLAGPGAAQISTPYPLSASSCGVTGDVTVTLNSMTVTDICSSPSDTYSVTGDITFTNNNSGTRYDLRLGLYDATTQNVLSSNCFNGPSSGNFGNLDGHGDCADIQNGGTTVNGTTTFVLPCSVGGQPVTSLNATLVLGYTTGSNTVNTSTSPVTGAGSQRCVVNSGSFEVPYGPLLRLQKLAQGAAGSFTFNTTNLGTSPVVLNASTAAGGGNFTSAVQTLYIDGSLFNGTSYDSTKNLTINEVVPATGWQLDNIACSTTAGTIGSFNAGSATYTINGGALANNQVINCVATNTAQGNLSLSKVVNAPAGLTVPTANSWRLGYTDGAATSGSATGTGTTPLTAKLRAGSYSITEQLPGNGLAYDVAVSCTGGTFTPAATTVTGGTVVTLGSVTVAQNANVSCTVTNTPRTARLTLAKTVQNNGYTGADAGTTANFNLSYSGGGYSGSGISGAPAVTSVVLPVGTYSLAETPTGLPANLTYAPSLACAGGTLAGSSVTLSAGQNATCTFTNSLNAGRINLSKSVSAPAGVSVPNADAWTMGVTNGGSVAQTATGTGTSALSIVVPAGSYSLTEQLASNAFGYNVALSCTGGTATAGATSVTDGSSVTVGSVAVTAGATVNCTVTNTLQTSSLTLVKSVENGSATVDLATPADWTLSYAGPASGSLSSGGSTPVPAGSYTISEAAVAGLSPDNTGNYTLADLSCTGAGSGGLSNVGATGGTLAVTGNGDVTCTFTNRRATAQLTLLKTVVNDNGGTAVAGDFTLSYDGTAAVQGTPVTLAAGAHTLTESSLAGYLPAATPITCAVTGSGGSALSGSTLTLGAGDAVSCTFTNEDIAPTYDMAKSVSPTAAAVGESVTYSFAFTNNGPWTIADLTPSDPLPGLGAMNCGGGSSIASLAAGATATCTASYTVTQADVDGTGNAVANGSCASGFGIPNTASSTATETDGTALSETTLANNSALVCMPVRTPSFTIVKDVDLASLAAPGTLTYTITVTNTGNVTLTGGAITDDLPVDFGGAAVSGLSIP
ncbi:beta strand repeat-containing protein, partial [Gemmobacter caeruleus]|uniref:beta strand repeat-containing protein n=1 Tax=Gemmobacter caeruleus TaxID=2595004 RepID=UPI0011EE6D92